MIKAVFFDLDGTLCNTLSDLTASVNYAMRTFDFPVHTEDAVRRMIGDGIKKLCERAVPADRQAHREQVRALFLSHYAAHCLDRTRPYDGMREALAALKADGLLLAVLTNKNHASAEKILSALFPAGTFSFVLGQTDRYPLKPDPATMLAAMDALSLRPCEVVYVGDTDVDVRFAENADVAFCGCAWGFRGRAHLLSAGAKTILDTPRRLSETLQNGGI